MSDGYGKLKNRAAGMTIRNFSLFSVGNISFRPNHLGGKLLIIANVFYVLCAGKVESRRLLVVFVKTHHHQQNGYKKRRTTGLFQLLSICVCFVENSQNLWLLFCYITISSVVFRCTLCNYRQHFVVVLIVLVKLGYH